MCKRKFKYPPWWDEKLTIMCSKLRKIAFKNKTPEGRDLYTSLRRDYKKAIITAKWEGWKKFTSEIKHPSDVSILIKSFNNRKNNALGLLKKNKDGDYCDNPTESLNILLSKFFPGHASLSETEICSRDDDGMDWKAVKKNYSIIPLLLGRNYLILRTRPTNLLVTNCVKSQSLPLWARSVT